MKAHIEIYFTLYLSKWGGDFLKLYPGAKVLVATREDFAPAKRKQFCAKISDTEFYDWSKQAREKKAECDSGALSLDEFTAWLKHS